MTAQREPDRDFIRRVILVSLVRAISGGEFKRRFFAFRATSVARFRPNGPAASGRFAPVFDSGRSARPSGAL